MIRKLRGRTLAELQDRGAHVLRVLADRRGWFVPTLVAGEVAPIVTPWAASQRALDGEALVMLPDAVRNALVARADLVCADRFPLLGHAALDYGSPPDWQRDPVSGMRAPMRHWSLVPYLDADVVGDHKVTWEVNRHQWLLWLAQAWRLTGDARYPRHA
ncbi:MAG: hypothetical protein MUE41_12570, partial [Gemmatimonadaceae bacterium]|nr:hypothetical protein [Gemmatimonadaceae bacterium]